jgi:hypothetical protein
VNFEIATETHRRQSMTGVGTSIMNTWSKVEPSSLSKDKDFTQVTDHAELHPLLSQACIK